VGWHDAASARWIEPRSNGRGYGARAQRFTKHVDVNVEISPHRVITGELLTNAVYHRLIVSLFRKRTEDAIPNNENAAVIAVDAVAVLAVVHSMIGGRDEDPINPAEFADEFGMDPILIEQIGERDGAKYDRRNPEYGHW